MSHPWQHRVARASRRRFLVGTAAALTTPWIVPASALGRNGHLPPSERITIGMLGVGNRGSSSLRAMQPLPDHQVLAIADCRRDPRNWLGNWSRSFTPIEQAPRNSRAATSTTISANSSRTMTSMPCGAAFRIIGTVWCTARRFRPAKTCTAKSPYRAGSSRASGSAMPCDATAASSRRERSNAVRLIFGTPANWPSTATSARSS